MNEHALGVLEFPRVLAHVAERASSELGAARVRKLAPSSDRSWITSQHQLVTAARALTSSDVPWRMEPVPDTAAALKRLRAAGSVWSPVELLAGAVLLRSSRLTRDALTDQRRPAAAIAVLAIHSGRLVAESGLESAIDRAIDVDAGVRDGASPDLRRVRRELRGAQGELIQLLERAMARLEPHQRVADMSVTVRNGRYVIPVRREGRGAVGGIVHDESATRGTLFIEPPAAVEFGNRIRALEADETREVQRILNALTDQLRPHHEVLTDALEALVELDALYARARFAQEFDCASPTLRYPSDGFSVRNARHPLLLARGGEVVPFDLTMEALERTLLLSGPNTGGKTVLLKAIGLLSAMTQAGIPAPVGDESSVAVFDDVFADIGDEQSIQASLSTFSAHLKNLGEILERATADSLVLVDELGSGTDPAEGAALGGAIIEELTRRGTLTIATTHLGALKLLATEFQGVVNASLQFDEKLLAPTYRLIKGIPGRSYGLSIARRLRLPDDILSRAEERLPKGERDIGAFLASLELRDAELAERETAANELSANLETRVDIVAERERRAREEARVLEKRGREDARSYLLEARAQVEEVVRSLRQETVASGADAAVRDARRYVETLAGEQAQRLEALGAEIHSTRGEAVAAPTELAVGGTVEVSTLGGRLGRIVEFRGPDATVVVGALKLTVSRSSLVSVPDTRIETLPSAAFGDIPEVAAPTDVDLRGLRVDEIDSIVLPALDNAIRADLKTLRIIHGKGTGALRMRVAEMLRADSRVRAFRLGAWNEGGTGVTVAELS
ncbi:MAG: Smr/MutS family protein [Gemmatimonadaceae bacterium]|nr:Smr/MutS family protein [Gemmatimonadaceae bacterium]MDQ3519466.1 Smr/MutS family protein [Gemmatimonadota bacterium]